MRGLFRQFWLDLLVSKHYVIAATIVFATSWVIGATDSSMSEFLISSTDPIRTIAQKIDESANPQLYFFLFIFFNNLIKLVMIVFLGAFLGIWPLVGLVINGMVLGYVLDHQVESAWIVFAKGILPHGIIELPAIILASAYGMRFGGTLLKSFFMLLNAEKRVKAGPEVVHFLWMTVPLLLVLAGAVLTAAIIESTITYQLMRS